MKYKFIINEPVLDGQFVALSETEKDIVIATVVGYHSLLLEGFQTERITKAIKLLRDYNKPFVTVHEDCTDNELIGIHERGGVTEGLVTEADGGYLYAKDLSSLPHSILSWITTVMGNHWIKLCCMGRGTVTLPADFKLIAETKMRMNDIGFSIIVDTCDMHYRCEEDERREIYSLNYLKEEIDKINEFSKDFDDDIKRFSKRAEASIPRNLYRDKTIRLSKTLSTIKMHTLVMYDDLEIAYKLTK